MKKSLQLIDKMSSIDYSKIITLDKAAKGFLRLSLKVANSVMAVAGIAIFVYSLWMIVVCLREYSKYRFPWFLWACLGTGIMFNFTASLGFAGVDAKRNFLLSLYIPFLFLLILAEALITADVFLNDDWDKNFPKDHTDLFDDFVDFVDDHSFLCKFVGLLVALSQIISFSLALVIRILGKDLKYEDEEVISAKLPFIHHHQIKQPPAYFVGHPDLLPFYYPAMTAAPYEYMYDCAEVAGNKKVGCTAAPTFQANTNKNNNPSKGC